jgi:hypothetical protein
MKPFIVILALLAGPALSAQPGPTTPVTSPRPEAIAASDKDARDVRERFAAVLTRFPPEVGRILKMDPTMLGNPQYVGQYPALQQFLAAHPEVLRNPSFYLQVVRPFEDSRPTDPQSRALAMWEGFVESISVFAVLVFVSGMVAWLVTTLLSHRRWLRVSRVQTEVHNKLLDRFAGTNELLAYIETPAGRRFLEAAPIPVEPAPARTVAAPLNRILWSVQAGIVLLVGGIGFQFVSGRVMDEVAQGLWALGVIATAFGAGFILAGASSFVVSRRLGLLEPSAPLVTPQGDSPAV